ncbi:UNVERIFIED_CONTAM: hypothetical protein HDU68_007272 [Siphonaria sp. JEL0065]|nr:hypothetical protein HDU68_007272 [Siphonaria sp. JEL0065]
MSTPANPFSAVCGATGSAAQLTFTTCVGNALYSTTIGTTVQTVETLCQPTQSDLKAWYTCLCNASQAIVTCYTNSCSNDTTFTTAKGSASAYCDAAQAPVASKVTGTIGSVVPGVTTTTAAATGGVVPTNLPSGPTLGLPNASTTTAAAKSGAIENIAFGFVSTLVFALLA